jgi:hypothetical protein
MPFTSKALRRKFAELLVKGEIAPETYEERQDAVTVVHHSDLGLSGVA